MFNQVRTTVTLFALAALMASGCGGAPAKVSGTVTVQGKTYQGLRVSFIPEAGGATATCVTDAEGDFTVRTGQTVGLEPGEYRMTVTGFSKTPNPTMTPEQVKALLIVPPEHSNRNKTPHRATVEPGHNQIDITI